MDSMERQINLGVLGQESILAIQSVSSKGSGIVIANFKTDNQECSFPFEDDHNYCLMIDSADAAWGGPGSLMPAKAKSNDKCPMRPLSIAAYHKSSGGN
jgi:hypothetical protein